jgi:hypothetical protein
MEGEMDAAIIQKRVDDLSAAMLAKGLRQPVAEFWFKANAEPTIYLKWKSGIDRGHYGAGDKYEFISGPINSVFEEAAAKIAAMDDPDQAKLKDFLFALGSVIDLGNQHGIEADYLNPLVASMKKLSKNIITDQRAA